MFNICNSKENGEEKFFNNIKDNINIVFDVGCCVDSEYINFKGEVHYFDPVKEFIDNLSKQPNQNMQSYFNNFGLGNENKELFYYPTYQSFYDRVQSCEVSDDENKILLTIKRGMDYMLERNVTMIDFLKIDTEGFELQVLQGFAEQLQKVNIIQFEYGGTFLDNNVHLADVIQYLESAGFHKFSYITPSGGTELITDTTDHYQYCNIVCINKNSGYQPF